MPPYRIVFAVLSLFGLLTCYLFLQTDKPSKNKHALLCNGISCSSLVHTPYGRTLYFPNWLYGVGYYLLILYYALLPSTNLQYLAIICASASVILGIYLVWALIIKLRYFCFYCYSGHLINIVVFSLLIYQIVH